MTDQRLQERIEIRQRIIELERMKAKAQPGTGDWFDEDIEYLNFTLWLREGQA
ncbi:hypothetical protein Q0V21_19595 [Paenibacillus sp. 11B]|uniref:hypothetical protein n=1 Tax=unclassified Paenibacillus TaxID=185978 RepID=UPI0015D502A4|nr:MULTISPECIES: hypothetical protein [unclassified Paenibacillus]MDN8590967.1 hypothetical protein [Paenibacillus sp. 11B]